MITNYIKNRKGMSHIKCYKYSKIAFAFEWILVYAFEILLCYCYYLYNGDFAFFKKICIRVTAFLVTFILLLGKELLYRKVEIDESGICFNNFRFRGMSKTIQFALSYSDVISLKIKRLPLIGIINISINAKNIPHPVKVSCFYSDYKNMFEDIITNTRIHNPDVIIQSASES